MQGQGWMMDDALVRTKDTGWSMEDGGRMLVMGDG